MRLGPSTSKLDASAGAHQVAQKIRCGALGSGEVGHDGCHAWGVLGTRWWEALGAASSSPGAAQEQPGAAQERQDSFGTALGEPRASQHTSKMTLSARSLGRQISLQPSCPELRGLKIHQIGSLTRKKDQIDL